MSIDERVDDIFKKAEERLRKMVDDVKAEIRNKAKELSATS